MSQKNNECRRCDECRYNSHHWIYNPGFCDEGNEEYPHSEASHICKHCDAIGMLCEECGGDGQLDSGGTNERGDWISLPCETCKCEGVVILEKK